MKKYVNLIVLMCLLATGCAKQGVVITIDVLNQPEVNRLIYSAPLSGTIYYGFSDTLKAKETGKFELKLELKQPSFIAIWDERAQNRVKMLVEPGRNYHVSMDSERNVQITGANEKGQMLYTTLPDPIPVVWGLGTIGIDYTTAGLSFADVHHKISELKQAEMSGFKELLDKREITKSFFKLVQKDRDCYCAALQAIHTLITVHVAIECGTNVNTDELLQTLKEIIAQYPPNDESFLLSSFWGEYAESYVKYYRQLFQEDFDVEKLKELIDNRTFVLNESKKYLNGKMLEFFRARTIHYRCLEGRTILSNVKSKKDFISLFEDFEKDYPESEYSKYIRPHIDEIVYYHQVMERPFDEDILFLDNFSSFATLDEVTKPWRGKKIYIMIWRTGIPNCNECEMEFQHHDALKKILAENDVQLLYMYFNYEPFYRRDNWKDVIKLYHLTGLHFRANEQLRMKLNKQLDKTPWYLLIDEKGNIIAEPAKSPSELVAGEKLF